MRYVQRKKVLLYLVDLGTTLSYTHSNSIRKGFCRKDSVWRLNGGDGDILNEMTTVRESARSSTYETLGGTTHTYNS